MKLNIRAFTLIELLIVVLIIGILAAVALPQYKKAVEKSKAVQAFILLKNTYTAANNYYLSHGTWPQTFEQLDLNIPFTGHIPVVSHMYATDTLSNEDWSLQLYNEPNASRSVLMYRLNGPYQKAGFLMCQKCYPHNTPKHEIICRELPAFNDANGSYCKIFHGTRLAGESIAGKTYKLP